MKIYYLHEFIEELESLDKTEKNQIKKKLKELYRTDKKISHLLL